MNMKQRSKVFRELDEAANTLVNSRLRSWKDQGGRIAGYFCSYVPEEVITAAGFLPFRMRATGSKGTELADAYFTSINCSFPRHCFNLALQGKFDFLDGVICINTCDHVRRIYDNWKRQVRTPFLHILSLPRKTGEPQVDWYRTEIANLRKSIEGQFGIEITDEDLWEAIKLHNETRRLQKRLYQLRKRENPPITGAETLAVMVASTAMPKKQYNALVAELLSEVEQMEAAIDYRARLMIVGGMLDDPAYIEVIEGQGGVVVADSLCFGSRIMWAEVNERASDPITALAQYYIAERPHCPRMFEEQARRPEFVMNMVREFKVDGVIGERLMFCDQWLVEHFMLEKDLKEKGIPFLKLDREYTLGGIGQLRTRVQAFLETMGR